MQSVYCDADTCLVDVLVARTAASSLLPALATGSLELELRHLPFLQQLQDRRRRKELQNRIMACCISGLMTYS